MGQRSFESVSIRIPCQDTCSPVNISRENLRESLPSAANESMPLRPMHVLDPVYPQLPVDFDWGPSVQWQDHNRQPASSSDPPDFSQWVPTSQMSIFPSPPYFQNDQQPSHPNTTSLSHWTGQLYSDPTADDRNSAYIPFTSIPDDWSSQPPPRIRSHPAHAEANIRPVDIRWSTRGSPLFVSGDNLGYRSGLSRDGSGYERKGLSYMDGGIARGIYTKI
jgi:hypothetical protein